MSTVKVEKITNKYVSEREIAKKIDREYFEANLEKPESVNAIDEIGDERIDRLANRLARKEGLPGVGIGLLLLIYNALDEDSRKDDDTIIAAVKAYVRVEGAVSRVKDPYSLDF